MCVDRFGIQWMVTCAGKRAVRPGEGRLSAPYQTTGASHEGRTVFRGRLVTDGPFGETKEVIGGYWFVVAGSIDEAAAIAGGNKCLACGLFYEIRPIESVKASAFAVTTETPRELRGER